MSMSVSEIHYQRYSSDEEGDNETQTSLVEKVVNLVQKAVFSCFPIKGYNVTSKEQNNEIL